jgi:hypothetical protein
VPWRPHTGDQINLINYMSKLESVRKSIPVEIIKDIKKTCMTMDDDLRWLIALLSDAGMPLGEAVGL